MSATENRKVRREDLRNGFESRPTSRQQREEAERLNRGLGLMETYEAGEDIEDDDDD